MKIELDIDEISIDKIIINDLRRSLIIQYGCNVMKGTKKDIKALERVILYYGGHDVLREVKKYKKEFKKL